MTQGKFLSYSIGVIRRRALIWFANSLDRCKCCDLGFRWGGGGLLLLKEGWSYLVVRFLILVYSYVVALLCLFYCMNNLILFSERLL